ncbi:sporulation peptidase YabG [Acetivibrio saccincola]|jgi:hypothetical protein|nr:sporulation peptidase YabG [Acetivibrio saccincola]
MYNKGCYILRVIKMALKIGDIVSRKSYGSDILFEVVDIKRKGNKKIALLNALFFRLEADAPETDLVIYKKQSIQKKVLL